MFGSRRPAVADAGRGTQVRGAATRKRGILDPAWDLNQSRRGTPKAAEPRNDGCQEPASRRDVCPAAYSRPGEHAVRSGRRPAGVRMATMASPATEDAAMNHPPMVTPSLDPTRDLRAIPRQLRDRAADGGRRPLPGLRAAPRVGAAGPGGVPPRQLGLSERPAVVLTTALRAMGLLTVDDRGPDRADGPGQRAPDARRRLRRQRLHRPGGRGRRGARDGRAAADEPAGGRGRADEAGAAFIFRRGSSRRWSARPRRGG